MVRVDIDRDGVVAAAFDSSGVPDYVVFRDGELVDRIRFVAISWFLEQRLRRMVTRQLE